MRPTEARSPRARRPRDKDDRPPAPWGSFPLVELVILLAIVLLGAGLFVRDRTGLVMILSGLGLGVLGGTEVSIREHFAGYRSHTILLAGVITMIVITLVFVLAPARWPRALPLAAGAAVFGGAFYLLRETFKRKSGGLGFR